MMRSSVLTTWMCLLCLGACGGTAPGDEPATDAAPPDIDAMSPQPGNRAPIAVLDDQTVLVDETVSLSGLDSTDPDGDTLQYQFSLRSRPPLSQATLLDEQTPTASFVADRAGIFVVDLVVRDGQLDSAPTTAIIAVLATEDAPMAYAGADRTVRVGTEVSATGLYSTDPNDLPLLYSWSWLDKPTGSNAELDDVTAQTISFTADVVGDYQLELTVHNGSHPSAPDQLTITAVDPGPVQPGDVVNGVFNPDEVYIFGTLSEGACYRDAIAHWSDPDTAAVGFDCYANEQAAQIRLDGTVIYFNTFEDLLREFHCDDCPGWTPGAPYPSNVLANDTILATPPCDMTGISGFIVGVTGERLHRCGSTWYNEVGASVPLTEAPLSFGPDNQVLTDSAVVDIQTGAVTPITGLPDGDTLATRVADATSFWVARDEAGTQHLWRVGHDGAATLEATYAEPPSGYMPSFGARLDIQGTLFQEGRGPMVFEDVIIARSPSGLSEVVYTEANNPAVKLHISSLITGP